MDHDWTKRDSSESLTAKVKKARRKSRMGSSSSDGGCGCIIYAVLIIFMILFALIQPYFEMRTFNKFNKSGEKATYFDAVFAQLRVEARSGNSTPATVNTNETEVAE
jgi:hypothetical protein